MKQDQDRAATTPVPPQVGRRTLRDRTIPELAGYALFPLAILFLLNFVDEFDRIAFGTLTPEIKEEFGLSNAAIGGITALALGLVWVFSPAVGFIADRWNRVRLSLIMAVAWGATAFFTGIVGSVWLLALVRFGSGAAKIGNFSVHPALLADYYPPETRGRVFSLHRVANPLAAIVGPPIAGVIGRFLGWRAAFFILAIPTFVVVLAGWRLKEPLRGATEDPELAAEAAHEPPIRFGRAVRWLYSVPTLKRIYLGSFWAGLGAVSYLAFLSIFYDEVFGVNAVGRGIIGGFSGGFALIGLIVGGRLTDRYRLTKTFRHIALLYGGSVAAIGVALVFLAGAPALPIAIVAGFVASFFDGVWVSPYLTTTAFASPARIRSLGFSYAGMFFALGTFGVPITGAIADDHGIRWAMVLSAAVLTIGGAILATSARFANRDVERALRVLATEVELRHERLAAGARSLLVARDLDVAYDNVQVLFGVDFEVREGELVALLGTNGAGKSTLLKTISGLVHPIGGAVFFEGKDITHYEPEETAATGIIQMPGGKAIFPSLTVTENLEMAGWMYARERAYIEGAKKRVLETFPVLAGRLNQVAASLSGGEQQMLSLGQAFIARPKLLMIDELSLGLAPVLVKQLIEIVKEIHSRGTTIILVEQSVNVALTVAEKAYFMEKGEIRFSGPTSQLLARTDILRSVFLEGAASLVGDGSATRAGPSRRAKGRR